MTYTIHIGALTQEACHSEMSVDSLNEAMAYLHAFARKTKPEPAIADIGDFRAWVGNNGLESVDLSKNPKLAAMVEKQIARENETDKQDELDVNQFIPDIKITPVNEGVAIVYSMAMNCEYPVSVEKLAQTVAELITEYQDLVAAGEVSVPKYYDESRVA